MVAVAEEGEENAIQEIILAVDIIVRQGEHDIGSIEVV